MPDSPSEITKGYVNEDVLERIVKGEPTLQDLKGLSDSFASNTYKEERIQFVKDLKENLTPDALHKLNSAIMKNADEITVDGKDPNLVYRTSGDTIYKELLQAEAEKTGMKVDFGENNKIILSKLSPAIEDHYATLSEKGGFYDKRANLSKGDSIESRIAKSVGFLIDSPLAKESEQHKKLYTSGLSGQEIGGIEDAYKDARNELNNEALPQHKTYEEMGIEEVKLTDKEVREKVSKIGKPFSKSIANNIIDATLKNLESENFKLDEEHKTKITAALSVRSSVVFYKLSVSVFALLENFSA
ncbi:MAG TPA: DUF5410 domain-containing protein [Rickettsia endosymbiont of Bembidion lapponicum]|nr:DUF5410 domain-containing protein [Rickettsia endosymbiont of Bembidion lapponicum]